MEASINLFYEMITRAQINGAVPTLRDQFAMAALTGLLASESVDAGYSDKAAIERAFRLADQAVEARKQTKG